MPKTENPTERREAKPHEAPAAVGPFARLRQHPLIIDLIVLIVIAAIIGGIFILRNIGSRVYIENSMVSAPIISLSPQSPGILEKVRVQEGDAVGKGTVVAIVNSQPIKTETQGIIVAVQNTPGGLVTSQTAVVQMVDPHEFRVIGRVDEDKGLADIRPGQKVIFTVDAFGSKQYQGTVDTIVPTAHQSDIVFSISNTRQVQQFDVKVKFDVNAYPALKNGMSAKMWIYK
jgi:multidrug resistance efflux pump